MSIDASIVNEAESFVRQLGHAYDPQFGRKLPRALSARSLTGVRTRADAVKVRADPEHGVPQWELANVRPG